MGDLVDRSYGLPGTWSLSRCPNPDCGLVWLDPMPLAGDIGKVYDEYYTHSDVTGPVALSRKRRMIQAIMWGYVRSRMGYREGVGPRWHGLLWPVAYTHRAGAVASQGLCCYLRAPRGGNKLLEIGFGNGDRLALFDKLGWQVEGVEPDPVVVEAVRARGINVRQGELADQAYEDDTFDAIVMNHVLEHVHNPVEFLCECRGILKPGGALVAVQPNAGSWCSRLFGSDWVGWQPPSHLYMYRMESMRSWPKSAGWRSRDCSRRPPPARTGTGSACHTNWAAMSQRCR